MISSGHGGLQVNINNWDPEIAIHDWSERYPEYPPSRPMTAYMFFCQDWRDRIKTENPNAGFGEVGKLLGAKWKELDDEEKKPYLDQAARDKERAEEEKTAYDSGSAGDDDDEEE